MSRQIIRNKDFALNWTAEYAVDRRNIFYTGAVNKIVL